MRFNPSLTCMCLMTVLLQYTCSAACMPLERTRTKNQAPTSSSQSSGECEALLSTEELASLRLQIRSKLQSISTQMNETTFDIFAGRPSSDIGLYTNRKFFQRDWNRQNESIAESHGYLRCFISPMADALKNETERNITDREPSYFNQFFTAFGNLPVANDIYKLVKGDRSMYPQCRVPTRTCPPLQLVEAPGNYTDRQQVIGAIAKELHFLAFDLLSLRWI